MKSLLRRLPRSKSKSRRAENTTSAAAAGGAEAQNTKQDDLRVPKIETADLKVSPEPRGGHSHWSRLRVARVAVSCADASSLMHRKGSGCLELCLIMRELTTAT